MLTVEKKRLKAGRLVNSEHVNSVIRNYKKERWVHNSERIGKEDSLSVWYSIEELEEFLAKAKQHGADGMRLYFGAYDQENAPRPLYEGRQTIVLVATKQKEANGICVNKDLHINNGEGHTILAYNVGHLCPPICTNDDGTGVTIIDKGKKGLVIA